jgi:hypothetical protein
LLQFYKCGDEHDDRDTESNGDRISWLNQ